MQVGVEEARQQRLAGLQANLLALPLRRLKDLLLGAEGDDQAAPVDPDGLHDPVAGVHCPDRADEDPGDGTEPERGVRLPQERDRHYHQTHQEKPVVDMTQSLRESHSDSSLSQLCG
jgi:hypothetical protein